MTDRSGFKRRLLIATLGLHCMCALGGSAQERTVSPFLPDDHWARPAVIRLVGLGVLDAGSAARAWPASRAEVAAWFVAAQRNAEAAQDTFVSRLATSFSMRLATELDSAFSRPVQARVAAGLVREQGVLRAGTMEAVEGVGWRYPGPRAVPDLSTAMVDADVSARVSRVFLLNGKMRQRGDRTEVSSAYLAARLGRFTLWGGRRTLAVGSAADAGIVLSGATLDGIGVALQDGVRVPGLGFLGLLTIDAALARTERSGSVRHPYFHSARIAIAPGSGFAIGLNRAMLFGGEGNQQMTVGRVALALIGLTDIAGKDSDFENQVASIDLLWKPLRSSSLLLYGELGADDTGDAFLHVPGVIAGAQLGRIGFDELQLGVELVHLDQSCCGFPPWYQHGALGEGWTDRGRLLGHPLGGAGTEAAVHWRVDVPSRAAILRGRGFLRRRGAENLFAPARAGRSYGVTVDLRIPWRRFEFTLLGKAEAGEREWRTGQLQLKGAISF